ncbi:MAG: MFS transporter [Anaerolineae bacterium]
MWVRQLFNRWFMRTPKRDAYTVFLILSFTWSFAFSLITTVNMVYQASVAGLSPLQLVLVGTSLEVTAFLLEVPTGVVADTYSRRLSVIIGYLLIGIGFLIEGLFPLFGAILLNQLIWGAGVTFLSGAQDAWLVDEVGNERSARAFLRASQMGNLGGLIGIIASTGIAAATQLAVPIVIGALVLIGLAGYLAIVMPETGFSPAPKHEREGAVTHMVKTLRGGVKLVRGRPLLLVIFGVIFFGGLYSEGFDRLWTPHLLYEVEMPNALEPVIWFGVLRGITMIAAIGMAEFVSRRVKSESSAHVLRAITLSDGGLILSLLVFALSQDFWLAAVMFVVSQTLRGALTPIFNAWSNRYIDSDVRATTLSMMSQMNAIGQIGGGPAIGLIAERFTVRAALVISTLLLAPVLPLYGWAGRLAARLHPQPETEAETTAPTPQNGIIEPAEA